jgi:hypothetical protein
MTLRSLGLGLATILALSASARSAEDKRLTAPMDRRAPVQDKVTACPEFGPGFVHVPGSGTCVRASGRVRLDYETSGSRDRRSDLAHPSASARLTIDTRSDTDYGPVRSVVRVRGSRE